jgi:hypothetical protein
VSEKFRLLVGVSTSAGQRGWSQGGVEGRLIFGTAESLEGGDSISIGWNDVRGAGDVVVRAGSLAVGFCRLNLSLSCDSWESVSCKSARRI